MKSFPFHKPAAQRATLCEALSQWLCQRRALGARTRRALQNGLTRSNFKTKPLPLARGQERSLGPWAGQWRAIGEGPVAGTRSRCRASGLPFGIHSPKAPRQWSALRHPLPEGSSLLECNRSSLWGVPKPFCSARLVRAPTAEHRLVIGQALSKNAALEQRPVKGSCSALPLSQANGRERPC